MSRRKRIPREPREAAIVDLAHDGRGVARIEGKTVFIDGALPGERVRFRYLKCRRHFDEGVVEEVLEASPQRVEPRCPHFGVCGGCVLQHLAPEAQIEAKQAILLENFARLGKVTPEQVLEPLTAGRWGYRRKARLGVKFVIKKGELLVGFRERRSPYVTQMTRCEVLHPSVGERIGELRELIAGLQAYDRIAQIEVAVDDHQTALVFRNLDPLSAQDRERLRRYAEAQGLCIFLQPGGPETVEPLYPEAIELGYRLAQFDVSYRFGPTDFTQVNYEINAAMVARALELLELSAGDRVLDLFCGLGNFSLPIATRAREVVGVEGDPELVERARRNTAENGIDNAVFHAADLSAELSEAPWWQGGFDKVLLDPPRSGAHETLSHLAALAIERIVYVSCNPSTLARDAGTLVNEHGYRLRQAGVMDMFPHTAHVESIALFTRD